MSGALIHDMSGPAIDAGTFDFLLQKFAPLSERIAVAVSGGPDSMALAFCIKRWAKRDSVAFIVDHGLRAESASEADQVKNRLEAIGLRAEILRWIHEPVAARLHEKARTARYRLLTEACRRLGIGDLLIAHQREDQAETILMRLSKASGIEGLSGIAAETWRDGVRLVRPFLFCSKQSLIATCAAAQIPFVTDPSNGSSNFARGRLRKILPLLADEGLTIDNLVSLGVRAAEAADAIGFHATAFLRDAACFHPLGILTMDISKLRGLPQATAMRALALGLRHMHGGDYPPERNALSALVDAIKNASPQTVRSLYGCLVSLNEKQLLILREPAAATQKMPIKKGESILWDQRWLVRLNMEEGGTVAALGNPPHDLLDRLAPGLRKKLPQGRARATLPALWRENTLAGIPLFDAEGAFTAHFRKQAFP